MAKSMPFSACCNQPQCSLAHHWARAIHVLAATVHTTASAVSTAHPQATALAPRASGNTDSRKRTEEQCKMRCKRWGLWIWGRHLLAGTTRSAAKKNVLRKKEQCLRRALPTFIAHSTPYTIAVSLFLRGALRSLSCSVSSSSVINCKYAAFCLCFWFFQRSKSHFASKIQEQDHHSQAETERRRILNTRISIHLFPNATMLSF